jgi:prepilin-type N-terminal cleavage/methylation domain-containing protein
LHTSSYMFPTSRCPLGAAGFTLAEVMIAVAVLTIGLLAIGVGFQQATSGVATGRGETTAVFLAEQRIEQLKAQALINFSAAALAAGTTTDYCAGGTACQGSPVSGPSYTRTTTITDMATGVAGCPATPLSCKEVQVRVTYRPVTSSGDLSMQRTVDVFTLLGPRT